MWVGLFLQKDTSRQDNEKWERNYVIGPNYIKKIKFELELYFVNAI